MISKATTCCFTGHRESKLPWGSNELDPRCVELKKRIFDAVWAVYSSGVRHFICGMASGSDLYFCEAVMQLRDEREDVSIEAAIPWEGQSERWPPEMKKRYSRLTSECDYQTLVQSDFSPDCLMRRNHYMVDSSGVLIAVYNGSPGGTRQTMLYAMRRNIEIIELATE